VFSWKGLFCLYILMVQMCVVLEWFIVYYANVSVCLFCMCFSSGCVCSIYYWYTTVILKSGGRGCWSHIIVTYDVLIYIIGQ